MIDQLKKAVVFIDGTYATTVTRMVNGVLTPVPVTPTQSGTGFLIFMSEPRLGEGNGLMYLVTNRHVLRKPDSAGVQGVGPYFQSMNARINTLTAAADGTQFANIPLHVVDKTGSLLWIENTTDDTVDLALTPIGLDRKEFDFKTIPADLFVTKELLKREHVNENDEVIFAGLFAWSPGAKKNYPIVRHGKLARLSDERVPLNRNDPSRTFEVHLADVMSFGGNSGSPVFLRLGGVREGATSMLAGYSYYLLGVMQAFFPEGMEFAMEVTTLRGEAAQNSGIAAVIPSQKIVDLLESPRGRSYRERIIAETYEQNGNSVEADASFRKSIQLLETSNPDHSDLAESLEQYARFLRNHKREREAVPLEEKAKRIRANVQTDLNQPKM